MTQTLKSNDPLSQLPVAVLFDMDGTLFPYGPAHEAGLSGAREKARRIFGLEAAEFDAAYDSAKANVKRLLGKTASSHSRLLYFQRMFEDLGLRTQILLSLEFEQTYWRSFLGEAHLFEEAKEFLDDLRIAGIPTAIVTDLTAQIQFRKVVYFELDHYFDYIVTSEEVGADKPAKAMFLSAVEKLGISEGPVWMIGDDPVADIEGSRQAIGAITFQMSDNKQGAGRADVHFRNFGELRRRLAALIDRSRASEGQIGTGPRAEPGGTTTRT